MLLTDDVMFGEGTWAARWSSGRAEAALRMPIGNLGVDEESQGGTGLWASRGLDSTKLVELAPAARIHREGGWRAAREPRARPCRSSHSPGGDPALPESDRLEGICFCSAAGQLVRRVDAGREHKDERRLARAPSTDERSRTGGSVNLAVRLMTIAVGEDDSVGRRQRTMINRMSSEQRFSHSPGRRAPASPARPAVPLTPVAGLDSNDARCCGTTAACRAR